MADQPSLRATYASVWQILSAYWSTYGGGQAIIRSPYFHVSIILSIISIQKVISGTWSEIPMQVLPNILGFTLGGYAIFLAFGNDRFRSIISAASKENRPSAFMATSSAFVHFVVLQAIALIYAIIANAIEMAYIRELFVKYLQPLGESVIHALRIVYFGVFYFINFVGWVVFLYALVSSVAAAMAIFRMSRWFDTFSRVSLSQEERSTSSAPDVSTAPRQ